MKRTNWMIGWILGLAGASATQAAMVEQAVSYKVGATEYRSVLVYDDAVKTPRPGVLLAPNWYGANDAAVAKAKTIAGSDYVILVADLFGKDVRPKNADEAGKTIGAIYKDRKVLSERVTAALAALRGQIGKAPIDGKHIAAVGFCFGGAAVLDLARSGADIAAVATFHGNLATDDPTQARNIKAKVLSMNGADDSYVPAEQIAAFQKEMTDAKVDWQFVNFSGTVHCFAEPDQQSPPGCVYNERSAKRGFTMMRNFFAEAFK